MVMMVVVMSEEAVVMVMMMVPPAVMVVVMVIPAMMMVMMMIAHELHVRGRILLDAGRLGGLYRPQHGDRIGNRIEQLGIRPRWREAGLIRPRDGGSLRRVERGQARYGANQSDDRLVHVVVLWGC